MKALLMRDVLTQRWTIVLASVYSLFFFGMFVVIEEPAGSLAYVVSGIAGGVMVTLGSFKADRNSTLVLMLSLPVTKREAVHEKFLLLFASAAFGFAAAIAMGAVVAATGQAVMPPTGIDAMRVAAGTCLLSALIPIYLRFGHKAVQVMVVGLLGLGIALQLTLGILVAVSPRSLTDVVDAVIAWYTRMPVVSRNLLWLGSGVFIAAVAYAISLWFFPRRDR